MDYTTSEKREKRKRKMFVRKRNVKSKRKIEKFEKKKKERRK